MLLVCFSLVLNVLLGLRFSLPEHRRLKALDSLANALPRIGRTLVWPTTLIAAVRRPTVQAHSLFPPLLIHFPASVFILIQIVSCGVEKIHRGPRNKIHRVRQKDKYEWRFEI